MCAPRWTNCASGHHKSPQINGTVDHDEAKTSSTPGTTSEREPVENEKPFEVITAETTTADEHLQPEPIARDPSDIELTFPDHNIQPKKKDTKKKKHRNTVPSETPADDILWQ